MAVACVTTRIQIPTSLCAHGLVNLLDGMATSLESCVKRPHVVVSRSQNTRCGAEITLLAPTLQKLLTPTLQSFSWKKGCCCCLASHETEAEAQTRSTAQLIARVSLKKESDDNDDEMPGKSSQTSTCHFETCFVGKQQHVACSFARICFMLSSRCVKERAVVIMLQETA